MHYWCFNVSITIGRWYLKERQVLRNSYNAFIEISVQWRMFELLSQFLPNIWMCLNMPMPNTNLHFSTVIDWLIQVNEECKGFSFNNEFRYNSERCIYMWSNLRIKMQIRISWEEIRLHYSMCQSMQSFLWFLSK